MKLPSICATMVAATVMSVPASAQELARDSSWTVTYDDPSVADSSLFLVVMKPGWHMTTPAGSGATLTQPDSNATGSFLLKSVIFTFNTDAKPFGPLFARRGDGGAPTEFVSVLLNNDGTVGLFHFAGTERHAIVPWTASDAIVRQLNAGGRPVKNVVTVLVGSATLRVYVNGTEVIQQAVERDFDGGIGFRVGAGTNLHVSELTVAALGGGKG